MKDKLIDSVFETIQDYHCDELEPMNKVRIHTWIDQFDESDKEFILAEFLHLLSQGTYLSKSQVKNILWDWIEKLSAMYKYTNLESFIRDSIFLNLQAEHKSQSKLLQIIDGLLSEKLGLSLSDCGTISQLNYIYIDDILATGSTLFDNLNSIFDNAQFLDEVISKRKNFICLFFCVHTWGANNIRKRLSIRHNKDYFLNQKQFEIKGRFFIENNSKDYNPKLNFLYPIETYDEYTDYLHSIKKADRNFDVAYRKPNFPALEQFFSSPDNRNRFENIFLSKGIDILSQVETHKEFDPKRPLGFTSPSNRTFGTGTMFFTFLNISNTCPLVLWWDNPAHNWKGLFPVKNRGIK